MNLMKKTILVQRWDGNLEGLANCCIMNNYIPPLPLAAFASNKKNLLPDFKHDILESLICPSRDVRFY